MSGADVVRRIGDSETDICAAQDPQREDQHPQQCSNIRKIYVMCNQQSLGQQRQCPCELNICSSALLLSPFRSPAGVAAPEGAVCWRVYPAGGGVVSTP